MDRPPRIVTRTEALELGFSRNAIEHRLSTGRWRRIFPGVYFTGQDLLRHDVLEASLKFGGPQACLSGATALKQYGLIKAWPARNLVLVPLTRRVRSRGWAQIRPTLRLPRATVVRGIELAPVARAVADHALVLRSLDDVRAITARAIQHTRCSLEQLASELDAGPRNGSALLRESLTDLGYGAWSAPEARAGRSLRTAGLGPFEQNAKIIGPDGKTYVVDFLWRELRAILEIDSREHHFDEAEWKATQRRHRELETIGYSVIHMPPSEVRNERRFIANVRRWLAGRARVA